MHAVAANSSEKELAGTRHNCKMACLQRSGECGVGSQLVLVLLVLLCCRDGQ